MSDRDEREDYMVQQQAREVWIENYSQGRVEPRDWWEMEEMEILQKGERRPAEITPVKPERTMNTRKPSITGALPERTDELRFWSKVKKTASCWLWTAGLCKGYGQARFHKKNFAAHRLSWLLLRGPIPEGMTLDHVKERCGHKTCVNPAHLEVVTVKENVLRGDGVTAINARKLFCKRGHEFTDTNIKRRRLGKSCRECDKYHESRRPARPGH